MEKFVESDPRQALLLPVDLRDWVPEDDLSHFVLAAVERVAMQRFRVNERGSGSAQYHPRMRVVPYFELHARESGTCTTPAVASSCRPRIT